MSTNNDAKNTKEKQKKKKKSSKAAERDEVEELLRAAEDETFLKMSLNSHMARGSSSQFIDSDLDRRFQALKSKKPNTINDITSTQQNPIKATDEKVINRVSGGGDDDDDLFARFLALKGSLPSYQQKEQQVEYDDGLGGGGGDNDDEEDEVDKVIQWAIDAARLDPSPPSDTDDELQNDDDDVDDEDDDVVGKEKKGKRR